MKDHQRTAPTRVPTATYRLQLNQRFTLKDALASVAYLDELGISDLYLSPVLTARPGSIHGYDVTDHTQLNPELGSAEDLETLAAELSKRGMAILLDLVPNHMCVSHASNKWWWDVLENGPSSPFASYFDIDWNPPKPELVNKILIPILGNQYGHVLEAREIRVNFSGGAFTISYWDNIYPAAPRSWRFVLEPALAYLRKTGAAEGDPRVTEIESILTALSYLPSRTETDPDKLRERQREKEVIKRRICDLATAHPEVQACIAEAITAINGVEGNPASFDRLEEMLNEQVYRLCFWRVAADEVNYRRFFDINDLGAIHVEDPAVFNAVHALAMEWVKKGVVQGLRVDHPDGLYDPARYFDDLQRAFHAATGTAEGDPPIFVAAEKILVGAEELRPWSIQGTTGYGFMNLLNGVFVDPERRETFLRLYREFSGVQAGPEEQLFECKRLILKVSMSGELNVLARRLDRISEQHRWFRDFTLENLREALSEVITSFPVYRTYLTPDTPADREDLRHIETAISVAKKRNPAMSASVFDFIRGLMLFEHPPGLSEAQVAERQAFAMRLQQITGQVMAKGLEDTAHYRYFPLASLNEVGGEPGAWSVRDTVFHSKARIRETSWPHAMLATTTHDTKRGEDVRARLNVLSEMPVQWFEAVRRWSAMNAQHRGEVEGAAVPSPNEEYLFYQTLLGTWPGSFADDAARQRYAERIQQYLEKATREAKLNTSWINPNEAYEAALHAFAGRVLDPHASPGFHQDFAGFAAPVTRAGVFNSLSQVVLKAMSPGIPDFYQGAELWDLNLVDPDNRGVVDFSIRREMLQAEGSIAEALQNTADGRIKMLVTTRLLRFRREHPETFAKGSYAPLRLRGTRREHGLAFARMHGNHTVITAAGRFFARFNGELAWDDTVLLLDKRIQPGRYLELISGREINVDRSLRLAELFAVLPVAVLSYFE
jgi:(1->4)-alpha-D-glucan 1-alpha-D-glucosylmutase